MKPKTVLSTGLIAKLEDKELESVVLHEQYHLKHMHPFMLAIGGVLTSALFFVPVIGDIYNKFRSVLETDADNYARKFHESSKYLELALLKVDINSRYPTFPSFSRRTDYGLNKINILISSLVVIFGLALYVFPTQSHATQDSFLATNATCSEEKQCSVHCKNQNMSKIEITSSNIQHNIILSSY